MIIDFSFILVVALALSGVIWGLDVWYFRPQRVAALPAGRAPHEPVIVEYARSFFPIILIVLVIRSFLIEPFRIPSDSMMPTLLDGDFIFVNKYTYGLRLPVLNTKFVDIGEPQRGDVVVFRLPANPSINYIKRLVGLPGDHIVVHANRVYINGSLLPLKPDGLYSDKFGYTDAQLATETLGKVLHTVMFTQDRPYTDFEAQVPAGHYFFMGDNRNNSQDSRFPQVGFVPEANLVGRAIAIWMNFRWQSGQGPQMPIWSRIGTAIH